MIDFFRIALIIVKKDILLELRSRQVLAVMVFLSLLMLVIFHLAIEMESETLNKLTPGVLWVIFAFAGTVGMGKTSRMEQSEDVYMNILFSSASVESFFVGKVLSNLVFLLLMELIALVSFVILFSYEVILFRFVDILPAILLGSLGFAIAGTLFSFLAMGSRYGELILPLLFLPAVLPVIVGGVQATEASFAGDILIRNRWLRLLSAFDILYLSGGLMLFRYVLQE